MRARIFALTASVTAVAVMILLIAVFAHRADQLAEAGRLIGVVPVR